MDANRSKQKRQKGWSSKTEDLKQFIRRKILYRASWHLTHFVGNAVTKLELEPIPSIVIESHNDFDGNGGAFYDYLIQHGFNDRYRIVWLLKHRLSRRLPHNVTAYSVFIPSLRKALAISRASIVLSENYFPPTSNPKQLSIYLTHGPLGLKNFKGLINIPERIDYCLSPSPNMDAIMSDMYDFPVSKMVHLGHPSFDLLHTSGRNERSKILSPDDARPLITWMPTFRKGGGAYRNDSNRDLPLGIPLVDTIEQYTNLDKTLKELGLVLVIKIHPMQDQTTVKIYDTDNIKVLTEVKARKLNINTYRLLAASDALISDYSSIAFNYLQLNRPLAYMTNDIKDYKLGFFVDDPETYMAGPEIKVFNDLEAFLHDVAYNRDRYETKRRELCSWMFMYNDCKNCERLAKFLNL